jgi:hypothetical protein
MREAGSPVRGFPPFVFPGAILGAANAASPC